MPTSEPVRGQGCLKISVGLPADRAAGLGWLLFGAEPNVDVVLVSYGPNGPGSWREVGLDDQGRAVFRFPDGRFPRGDRGFFDPHTPPVSEGVEIDCSQFDAAWQLRPIVPLSFGERLRELRRR